MKFSRGIWLGCLVFAAAIQNAYYPGSYWAGFSTAVALLAVWNSMLDWWLGQ